MRNVFAAAVVAVSLVGCAGGSASTNGGGTAMVTGSATLVGTVTPAEAGQCDSVQVSLTDAQNLKYGSNITVRESRGRCAFEIRRIPSDIALKLNIEGVGCPAGQELTFKAHETRTVSVKPACGGDAPAAAPASAQ